MERLLLQSVLSWPTHVAELCHVQPWSAHSCCNPHSNPSLCQDAGACAVFPPSPQRACASKPAGCSAQAIIWFYTLLNWQGKWKRLQPSSKWMSSDEGFIKLESTDDKSFSFSAFSLYFLLLNRKTTSYTSTRSPLLKATSWPQMVWFMLWAPSCSLRVGWCLEVLRATPSQQNCHQNHLLCKVSDIKHGADRAWGWVCSTACSCCSRCSAAVPSGSCGLSISALGGSNYFILLWMLWDFQHTLWNTVREQPECFECPLYMLISIYLDMYFCAWYFSAVSVPLLASRPQERGDEPADPALEIFKQASALSKVKSKKSTVVELLKLHFSNSDLKVMSHWDFGFQRE